MRDAMRRWVACVATWPHLIQRFDGVFHPLLDVDGGVSAWHRRDCNGGLCDLECGNYTFHHVP
eukprot:scaffold287832_cov27-Tisochrysis_lutea.AAC.1